MSKSAIKPVRQNGNNAAETDLEQTVREQYPRLRRFVSRWITVREDVEDVLQDVFYLMAKTTADNTKHIESMADWLFSVAHNVIINKGKRRRETSLPCYGDADDDRLFDEFTETLFSEDNPTPETMMMRSLFWQELDDALAALPPEQRYVFELNELEGVPVKDISALTGVPIGTLLSRKHYAVEQLRRRLKEIYLILRS